MATSDTRARSVTADDLLRMDPDAPFELIEGVLHDVSPSEFRSSAIASGLHVEVGHHCKVHGLGYVTGEGGGYRLSRDPDTVVAPDIGFVARHRLPDGFDIEGFAPFAPDLAVEVLSPTDRRPDVLRKIELYLRAGVRLVWIVDPRLKTVAVHRADGSVSLLDFAGSLGGEDVLPGFSLPVAHIFA